MVFLYLYILFYLVDFITNKYRSEVDLSHNNDEIRHFIIRLQHDVFSMASKYMTILVQKELDDTLLGFDKMPWTWMHDEKQHRGWKALSQIYFYLSNHILSRCSEGEECHCITVEIGVVLYD